MVTKKVPKAPKPAPPPKPEPVKYIFLAEHMADAKVDDQALADAINVDRVTVTRYRKHQERINLEKLDRIAKALKRPSMALYRPPGTSLDAKLQGRRPETVQHAIEMLDVFLKRQN